MLLVDLNKDYKIKEDKQGNLRHYNISYSSDKAHKLDMFIPYAPKSSACIILIHGGGWVWGSKAHMRNLQEFLLKHGIASANIDYRLVDDNITYKDQMKDVAKAIAFVNDNSKHKGIYLLGESAGGHLAMLFGYQNPDLVSKIITFAGPADLYSDNYKHTKIYKAYTQKVFAKIVGKSGSAFQDIRPELKEASPIAHVSNVPTLTFQGTWDYLVHRRQSFTLNNIMKRKGFSHDLVIVKRGNHTLRFIPYFRKNIVEPKLLKFIFDD